MLGVTYQSIVPSGLVLVWGDIKVLRHGELVLAAEVGFSGQEPETSHSIGRASSGAVRIHFELLELSASGEGGARENGLHELTDGPVIQNDAGLLKEVVALGREIKGAYPEVAGRLGGRISQSGGRCASETAENSGRKTPELAPERVRVVSVCERILNREISCSGWLTSLGYRACCW